MQVMILPEVLCRENNLR